MHIDTDPRGAREVKFARDRAKLRIHLKVSGETRRVGKTCSILIVVAQGDLPLGTEVTIIPETDGNSGPTIAHYREFPVIV